MRKTFHLILSYLIKKASRLVRMNPKAPTAGVAATLGWMAQSMEHVRYIKICV